MPWSATTLVAFAVQTRPLFCFKDSFSVCPSILRVNPHRVFWWCARAAQSRAPEVATVYTVINNQPNSNLHSLLSVLLIHQIRSVHQHQHQHPSKSINHHLQRRFFVVVSFLLKPHSQRRYPKSRKAPTNNNPCQSYSTEQHESSLSHTNNNNNNNRTMKITAFACALLTPKAWSFTVPNPRTPVVSSSLFMAADDAQQEEEGPVLNRYSR